MNQFLALAGAFAPPPPATSPATPPPPAARAPAVPGACPCGNRGACATAPPVAPPRAPAAPAAVPPAAPRLHQLTDASGQTWTHADKATLEAYVAARNAAPAYTTYYQAAPPPSYSRCGPRGCR